MTDKFTKTHPWRVDLLSDVVTVIKNSDGSGTAVELKAGPRMHRLKRGAESFRQVMINEHGAVCGPIYRA
jgi:hypothetical protein